MSADPSAGTASGPRGLRGLLLPGADAYMRDVEARARAGGVQSIAFDRAGVDKAIARVQDIGRQLRDAEMHADMLTSIETRGEPVSDHYAGVANEAGKAYEAYLRKTEDDLQNYIEELEIIRDKYVRQEEEIGGGFHGTGT
ncbi:MAG: hypothetical protein ACRDQ7_00625 [Haloechinothrix sp.]